jgi:hypothetical protein
LRRLVALGVLTLALGACGGGDSEDGGYPQESVDAFVSECQKAQEDTTEEACRCVIEHLQKTMPYEEFKRADAALKENEPVDEASLVKLRTAAENCR